MNPNLQVILHNITTRLAKLEEGQQKKEWVGLTDEERTYLAWESNNGTHCVAMTEAKLKEKNT